MPEPTCPSLEHRARSVATPLLVIVRVSLEVKGALLIEHETFFRDKKPAAVFKHAALRQYVTVFATMLGSKFSEVWVIDGYAGAGEYEGDDETPAEPGSPKIVCDIANKVSNCTVRGVFIEPDRSFAGQLRAVVKANSAEGRHIVLEGTAEQRLGEAVAAAGNSPLLIFLDPFGVALSFSALVGAIRSRPVGSITEVLLNFNVESVRRLGGYLAKPDLRDNPILERVDRFVGGDWWRQIFTDTRAADSEGRAAAAAEAVVQAFNRKMKETFGLDAVSVPIRRRPNTVPLFILVLYQSNPAAAWVFANAVSSANRDWREFHKRKKDAETANDNTLIPIEMLQDMSDEIFLQDEKNLDAEWVRQIERNLAELLIERPSLRVDENIEAIFGPVWGLVRETHLKRAWDAMAARGAVVPRDSGKLRTQTITRLTR